MEFSLFPPLEALQAAEFQIARQRRLDSPPNPVFFECVFHVFANGFLQSTVLYTFVAIKTGRKTSCSTMLPIPLSPQPLKNTAINSVFFNFFHVPIPVANSNIYNKKILPKTLFFDSVFSPMFPVKQTVIYTFFCHKGSKSFQNIAFDSVFVMFSSQTYGKFTRFFAIKTVSPKHLFLQCFQCSGIQKPCKNLAMYNVFFHFLAVFSICRKATKMTQNSISIPSCAQTPKKSSKNVENTTTTVFWSRCENRFWPPPAKSWYSDCYNINKCHWAFSVCCCPTISHAFTAKAVWADLSSKEVLEVKLPTIWTDERQRWEESEKRKKPEERRSRCAKKRRKSRENTAFFPMICGSGGSKK